MTSWQTVRDKLLAEDPRLREEYDKLGPRFAAISALIDAREAENISQSELARRMNVRPNVVSRLESAQHSPLLDTLSQYAAALGYEFRLSLVKQPKRRQSRARASAARAPARAPCPPPARRRARMTPRRAGRGDALRCAAWD